MYNVHNTTFKDLLVIQREHLDEWRNILKPAVYAELEKRVKALTSPIPDENAIVIFSRFEDNAVPRGTDILNIALNLAKMKWD